MSARSALLFTLWQLAFFIQDKTNYCASRAYYNLNNRILNDFGLCAKQSRYPVRDSSAGRGAKRNQIVSPKHQDNYTDNKKHNANNPCNTHFSLQEI
jgi:tryptophanase